MIMKSCRKSRLSGLVAFCRKLDSTEAKNEESLTSAECGVAAAAGSVESRETGGRKLTPHMQDEENAQANNTYDEQIQLGCAFHRMESLGSLTVRLGRRYSSRTFRKSVSQLLRTSPAFNLGQLYNGCAAEAQVPDPASVEKNPSIDHCSFGWSNVVSISYLPGEVSEDPDKVKIKL